MRPEPKENASSAAVGPSGPLTRLFYRESREAAKPWAQVFGVVLVAVELFVLLRFMNRFKLESEAFRSVALATFIGFAVHHFLPMKAKLPFFVALSLATTCYVLGLEKGVWVAGTGLTRTAILVGLGGLLIGVCHLPISFRARVVALLAIAVALGVLRAGWVEAPFLGAIWPVFGAMFMFRLALYLYDLQHEKEPAKPARTLAYFFMLPNVCFPLFPVVDYKTFARGYYKEDAFELYQRGVSWMTRGIIQMLLFRLVYYHVHVGPQFVQNGTDLIRFLLSNMLLYLRVSGQFHLVVGMLHLFGFGLPLTNNRYFLSASFTDYWRRVNIYWKDFILKMVFYPTMFRMKSWNQTRAMITATIIAFVVTWALHSYQWFWLRGQFPLVLQDVFFWGAFGVVVTANTIYEQKKGRQRQLGNKSMAFADALALAGKTAATFFALTMLWSVWNAQSMSQWLDLLKLADGHTFLYGAGALAVIMVGTFIFETGGAKPAPKKKLGAAAESKPVLIFPFRAAALSFALPAVLVFVFTSGRLAAKAGPEVEVIVQSLSSTKPNAADKAEMERGYYEDLMDVSRFNSQLNEALTSQPADWKKLEETDAERPSNDHRVLELVPSKETVVNGKLIKTNSRGLRDREYPLAKPEGTYRVAMVGSSHVLGWGVNAEETFESLIEDRLNKEMAGKPYAAYEVLNFGVNGYSPICQIAVMDKKVAEMKPDAIWFIAHANDPYWTMQRFGKAIRKGVPPPYPYLVELAKKAELDERTPELWTQRKLTPYWKEMVGWAYKEVADRARAMGAQPVYIFLPGILERGKLPGDAATLLDLARAAGFETVVLPGEIYQNVPPDALAVAPWDAHPNAKGHQLIADGLFTAIQEAKTLGIHTLRAGALPPAKTSTRAQVQHEDKGGN